MKIYEHVFSAIILVTMLLAAIFLASISPSLYRSTSEVEQLKMAAQKVLAQLLLSPGDPEDWGRNISIKAWNLSSFGLAVSTVFTREAFVLDPDKVQRLSKELPEDLYIPPYRFSELLGLGSREVLDYGAKMEFIPVLKVTMNFNRDLCKVHVDVTSEQGVPVIGANVSLGAFYVKGGRINLCWNRSSTDFDGRCAINLPDPDPSFLLAIVSYYGLQAMKVINVNSRVGYLIGDHLLIELNLEVDTASALQVLVIPSSEGIKLGSVKCAITGHAIMTNYKIYNVSYIEPNMVAIVALTLNGELLVAYKIVPESYSSIAGEAHAPLAYMLERSVKIGLFTYTVRLRIWRMAW